jgi:hypothetical protein
MLALKLSIAMSVFVSDEKAQHTEFIEILILYRCGHAP